MQKFQNIPSYDGSFYFACLVKKGHQLEGVKTEGLKTKT